jgi:catechol 2,3-dioxygenase-like lactoylglutathione lyase family enzyme
MDASREGLRLYFEIRQLDALCAHLAAQGVPFLQMPKDMPWGWRHAYLRDPDGHELSLYWAGQKRFKKTTMRETQ